MPQCPSCKTEVLGKSRFCHECGRRLSTQKSVENARTEEYAGILIKCPHCGDPVEPFETVCDACGYVFQDMQCSKSMRQFSASLSRLTSANGLIGNPDLFKERLVALIRGFTIPNNKQDIMEFFILAQANIDPRNLAWSQSSSSMKREIAEAWLAKLNQAYSKAMISFVDEEDKSYIEAEYEKIKEAIDDAIAANKRMALTDTLKNNIGFLLSLFLLVIAYIVDQSGGNSSAIALGGCVLLCLSAYIAGKNAQRLDSFLVPAICCIIYILCGTSKAFTYCDPIAQLSGLLALAILFGVYISAQKRSRTSK